MIVTVIGIEVILFCGGIHLFPQKYAHFFYVPTRSLLSETSANLRKLPHDGSGSLDWLVGATVLIANDHPRSRLLSNYEASHIPRANFSSDVL